MEYDISALCRLFGLTPNAIRYYEKIGLIHPAYSEGGRRKYSSLDICELTQVKTLQALGLDLTEISRHFHRIPEKLNRETSNLLRDKIADIDRQMALLEEARRLLHGYILRMEDKGGPRDEMREMTFPAVRTLSLEPFWGRTEKQQQVLAQWLSAIPAVRMIDQYQVADETVLSHRPCLCIREEVYVQLHVESLPEERTLPGVSAIEMNVQKPFDTHRSLDEKGLLAVIRRVRQVKGWQRMGIKASFLYTFMQNGIPMNYIEVWANEEKE